MEVGQQLYNISFEYKVPSRTRDDVPLYRYRCFTYGDDGVTEGIRKHHRELIEKAKQKLISWHKARGWAVPAKQSDDSVKMKYGKTIEVEIKNFRVTKFDRKVS